MAVDTSMEPLEQMIAGIFAADPILSNAYGPYFDWVEDPQGIPYVRIVPDGSDGPNQYMMPGAALGARTVITNPCRQFSVFSTDKALLTDPDTGILQAISKNFEAIANIPMPGGQVCLSSFPGMSWGIKYDKGGGIDPHINANIWHAYCRFEFRVGRKAGVL